MAEQLNKKRDLNELMKKVGSRSKKLRRKVVYGVYDNSSQPFWVRIDDFMIDHGRVSLEDKTYFFHLLAVMIDAGIPIINALKILASRAKSERLGRILYSVSYSVVQGKKFSDAMAMFPDVFGEMEVGIIRAGEAAGNMDKMLFKLSAQMDRSHELQMKLVTASIYPVAVLVVLLAVASGMLIWVIPNLISMLMEGGLSEADFPLSTKILLTVSTVLQGYFWAIIIGIVILYLIFKAYISSDNGKFKWDLMKLRLPIIGDLLRKVMVLRFISMLGILIEAGLPIIQALKIIAISEDNELYKLKTWEIISRVQKGDKISASLQDAPFLFPETITQMLSVAEQSASIGTISEKVAVHYDREIDNSLKRLTSLFEPVMIIFVGLSVALLALAILTPIFKLTQLV